MHARSFSTAWFTSGCAQPQDGVNISFRLRVVRMQYQQIKECRVRFFQLI